MNKKEKIEVVKSICAYILWIFICFVVISVLGSCPLFNRL